MLWSVGMIREAELLVLGGCCELSHVLESRHLKLLSAKMSIIGRIFCLALLCQCFNCRYIARMPSVVGSRSGLVHTINGLPRGA